MTEKLLENIRVVDAMEKLDEYGIRQDVEDYLEYWPMPEGDDGDFIVGKIEDIVNACTNLDVVPLTLEAMNSVENDIRAAVNSNNTDTAVDKAETEDLVRAMLDVENTASTVDIRMRLEKMLPIWLEALDARSGAARVERCIKGLTA